MDNKEQFNKLKISAYFFNFWSQSGFIIARLWNGFSEIWINAENKKLAIFIFIPVFFKVKEAPKAKFVQKIFWLNFFWSKFFLTSRFKNSFLKNAPTMSFWP